MIESQISLFIRTSIKINYIYVVVTIFFRFLNKALSNSDCLATHGLTNECELFFHDLGAQSAWNMVFFCQYFIPLLIYLMFYFSLVPVSLLKTYVRTEDIAFSQEYACHAAMLAHTLHYSRRIFEVLFVHRFSSATFAVRHIPKV